MAYNLLQKLKDNITAIELAFAWKNGAAIDAQGAVQLQKFSGFGGIKAILLPDSSREEWIRSGATNDDMRLYPMMMQLHALLKKELDATQYKQAVDSIRNSVLTAFYTPQVVPATLYAALKDQGIEVRDLYEPSAGAGIFVTEAAHGLPGLRQVTAVEKDILTGQILAALLSTLPVSTKIHITGLEEAPTSDNGTYSLVVSNIPFGNFTVYDPALPDPSLSGKIHNYFFAKGIEKVAGGGLLAYITTDAFLNNPSNQTAREYLFNRADFVSLAVMPDNLMKDTGNTEAPNHLLIVQKNSHKTGLSADEQSLIATEPQQNEFGSYTINTYIYEHPGVIVANEISAGRNQYGNAHQSVWQDGDINNISERLYENISHGLRERFDQSVYKASLATPENNMPQRSKLTFLPMPESKAATTNIQLGLFDTTPVESINRAGAYVHQLDETVVQKETARIISIIRTTARPDHESIVLIAAKSKDSKEYYYKLHSNVDEIQFAVNWHSAGGIAHSISGFQNLLAKYDYDYTYEGDKVFMEIMGLGRPQQESSVEIKPYYKEGTLVVHRGEAGIIGSLDSEYKQATFHPFSSGQKNAAFYTQYVGLRDGYLELSAIPPATAAYEQSREQLREAYEQFIQRYGLLNYPTNRRMIANDSAFGAMVLSSLERKEGERYTASDVLYQSVVPTEQHFSTDDPFEALARSLNDTGKVNISFIEAATSLTEAEVLRSLEGHIFLNPSSNEWETADQYLSGNVVTKLSVATEQASLHPDSVQLRNSLEAIAKSQPEKIPYELLDFNLGERWIPLTYYERFASELFGLDTSISYFPSLDTFKASVSGYSAKISQEYAVTPKSGRTTSGITMLEHALENTSPFFTYEVRLSNDKTIRLPDNEAIQLAHQKIESIRNGFILWLRELPEDDKNHLEKLYNDTFNCYVLRQYDGSHLTFPGLEMKNLGIATLYSSQKDAAWRIIQNRGALIDHEVGLGKTLTMIVAAHEMKRFGTVNKPMILALKANINQITETYRKAYPDAKILAPGENDFTPAKRMRLFHEIKNNNWDCIILTHDQFGKIPQSPDIQREIFQNELDNVERDLDTLRDLGGDISKKMLKGLEVRKNNLQGKLKGLISDIEEKKDRGINFGDMGVDHLFVDEAHKFKNLTFTTRHDRVAGIGNTEGSQKALNMLFAVRTLQARFDADLCVTFLSGTPISNSLTEMYLLFKYLRPKEMERQHIENFDGWAAVFARKTTDFEFSVTNEIISKERFRHFIKVPELALFYNEITDYKTAKHIRLDKPELDEHLVNIRPTPQQSEFISRLMAFAKTGDGALVGRPPLTRDEDRSRMLIATNYAKKMAADMRLIDSVAYDDHPDNKVNTCARKVAELYDLTAEHKGTQIVFSDIGTPKKDDFNIYDALKEKLVGDFHIPGEQITFIHDWTDKQKKELFRKMNRGEIRVLIGSTEKAGTGLNVQERVVAMHHMDIPWKPAELEQRDGRGARQGNVVARDFYGNKVQNYIYAVEQSLDNYKFNLLKNKQTFISQMKNCELNIRTIDEGAMDEKSGMNFSEYIAILSGDTSLLEKSKLEKKVAVMESLKTAHYREVSRSRYHLDDLNHQKESTKETLAKLIADEQTYKSQLRLGEDGTKENPIRLIANTSADAEAIGRQIIKTYQQWKPDDDPKIGSLYGFDLYVRQQRETLEENGRISYRYYNTLYAERGKDGIKYTYNSGHPNTDNPKLAARYFLNAIDKVTSLKERYQKTLDELNKEIPIVAAIAARPFAQDDELLAMRSRLSTMEKEIAAKIQESQMKQAELSEQDKEQLKDAQVVMEQDEAVAGTNDTRYKAVQKVASAEHPEGYNTDMPRQQPRLRRNHRLGL